MARKTFSIGVAEKWVIDTACLDVVTFMRRHLLASLSLAYRGISEDRDAWRGNFVQVSHGSWDAPLRLGSHARALQVWSCRIKRFRSRHCIDWWRVIHPSPPYLPGHSKSMSHSFALSDNPVGLNNRWDVEPAT